MKPTSPPIEIIHKIRDECPCLAAQRAARVLGRRFDRVFAPLGITNGQFSLMVALSGQWKPRMGELAEFLAMDQTTLSAAVKTLARAGKVELIADTEDARARRPRLTEDGARIVSAAIPLWSAEYDQIQRENAAAKS